MLEPDVDDDDLRKNKRALAGMSEPATSKLEQVLRCIYDMLSRKVISTPKDPVGVLLYGVVRSLSPFLPAAAAHPCARRERMTSRRARLERN